VIIQGRPEGILIRKLELEDNNCPNCRVNAGTANDKVNVNAVKAYLKNYPAKYLQRLQEHRIRYILKLVV
jgi:hypothetical protein